MSDFRSLTDGIILPFSAATPTADSLDEKEH